MCRAFAGAKSCAVVLLVLFLVVGISQMVMVASTAFSGLTAVRIAFTILFLVIYVCFTNYILNSASAKEDIPRGPFSHGVLIGMSGPFCLFTLAEATYWSSSNLTVFAGVSVLMAMLSGMTFGGIFLYSVILTTPTTGPQFKRGGWLSNKNAYVEWIPLGLAAAILLGAVVTMLILSRQDPPSQVCSIILLSITYLGVLALAIAIRLRIFSSHMSLGVLTGAIAGIILISSIYTFVFASKALVVPESGSAIAALVFQAALFVILLPLLIALLWVESTSEGGEKVDLGLTGKSGAGGTPEGAAPVVPITGGHSAA
jgi:hypothetical protein